MRAHRQASLNSFIDLRIIRIRMPNRRYNFIRSDMANKFAGVGLLRRERYQADVSVRGLLQ